MYVRDMFGACPLEGGCDVMGRKNIFGNTISSVVSDHVTWICSSIGRFKSRDELLGI